MILGPPLGDVVQEQRDVEHAAVARQDLVDQFVGERRFVVSAAFDLGKDADAAKQMLVHCVVVIHIELHHGDDLAESRHEAAEHAGLVHSPQHGLRVVLRGEDLEEELVGFLALAQFRIDQIERARDSAHRVRVECQVVLLRELEDADQVDRIALEHIGLREPDAVLVDDEVVAFNDRAALHRTQARHEAAQDGDALGVAVFQLRAEDRGQVADVLGDQEVVLHEALDVLQAGMFGVAEPHGDLALDVERQALLGAAHEKMHVAADRPEKILAAAEQLVFVLVEDAALDQLVGLAHAVDVFGNPEQRVQIAQARLCRP